MLIAPGALVAPSPVNEVVLSDRAVGAPTAAVAETPVKGIPSPIIMAPAAEVAPSPVNVVVLSTRAVGDPTAPVAETPVNPITSAGVNEPTEEVALIPVTSTFILKFISTEPIDDVAL